MDELIKESFYNQVLELFQNAKRKVSSAVNMTMVYSHYEASVALAKTLKYPCKKCGSTLIRESYLGENVYYCPVCQR